MKIIHIGLCLLTALSATFPAVAEPTFRGVYLWENDDAGQVISAEWIAECGGREYSISLKRSSDGENLYSVKRDGRKISEEIDRFISRNTSYFEEYNWLQSVRCGKTINRKDRKVKHWDRLALNFFGISKLPTHKYKPDRQAYNAYNYIITIDGDHISGQVRLNLEPDIVSDLSEHLIERDFRTPVPGTVISPDYCQEGPPCPEFTGENGEKAD